MLDPTRATYDERPRCTVCGRAYGLGPAAPTKGADACRECLQWSEQAERALIARLRHQEGARPVATPTPRPRTVPTYAYGPAYRAGISPWPELTIPSAPMTPEPARRSQAPVRELYRTSSARRPQSPARRAWRSLVLALVW